MSEFQPDIWRLQAKSDIRGLIEALKHNAPDVRRRAAAALRALGASSAIPALQAALVKEQVADVRTAFILTLDALFQQEVDEDSDTPTDQYNRVVRLIAQLNSRQPERIIYAARRLGELKEKIAVEALVMVFHNSEQPVSVRLAAAEALLAMESAPVEVALLGALRHADWRVRRNAAAVLGQLMADWAVEPLWKAMHDTTELVRRTAQAALKRIGTPEALIALATAAADLRPSVQTTPLLPAPQTPLAALPTASAATSHPLPPLDEDEEDTQPTSTVS
ncbi:MAG: HEAT repeat domain-containing protein [Chloroflexi bacterium]|nr:HEAT repeat domain-containing protein [Chloroflexota bacterium]